MEEKRLLRSRKNRVLGGICGGIGDYVNMDPTVIRIIYVLLSILTAFCGLLVYLILLLIIPEEKG